MSIRSLTTRLALAFVLVAPQSLAPAMIGHIIDHATITGLYSTH